MIAVIADHDVKDRDRLAALKREEVFGPAGVTNPDVRRSAETDPSGSSSRRSSLSQGPRGRVRGAEGRIPT